MYNKTFKTMDQYPLVFLIAIPAIVINLLSYILAGSNTNYLTNRLHFAAELSSLSQVEIAIIIIIGILSSGILFITVYPSVLNYIYNACNNNMKKGWYKYGLKRNSLRMLPLFIVYLLTVGLLLGFLLIIIYDSSSPFHSITLTAYSIPFSIILINVQIGAVSVVVEKKFGDSIKAFFRYFIDVFVPLFGTVILFGIPNRLLNNALKVGFIEPIEFFRNFSTLFNDYSASKIVISIIIFFLIFITEIFTTTFIYTYLTHKYIAERQEYMDNKKKESELDQIPSNP